MRSSNDNEWASDGLRNVQTQILKKAMENNPGLWGSRYTPEMVEQNIFLKAKTKNEYINHVHQLSMRRAPNQQLSSLNQQQQQKMNQVPNRRQIMPTMQNAGNVYSNSAATNSNQSSGFTRLVQHSQTNVPDILQSGPKQQTLQNIQQQQQPQQNYNQRPEWNHQYQQYNNQQQQRQQPPQQQLQQPVTSDIHHNAVSGISPAQQQQPTPQQLMNNSPGLKTPGSNHSAQSPASISMNTVPSPATLQQPTTNANVVDDKIYMDKLKQLQKYIEPLSRVIHKFNEEEEKHNKDYLKMKNLRDTLMNPQKRIPWSTLEKCEKVLQSWLDNKPSKPTRTTSPHQHMCQSIFNTIGNATKFPLLSHTLKRTFGPSVHVLCGEYATPDVLMNKQMIMQEAAKRMQDEERKKKVPTPIVRELTRLRSRFRFKIDQNWAGANDLSSNIQILCYLMDDKLPAIPPVRLVIPRDYPDGHAQWICPKSSDINQSNDGKQGYAFHEVLLDTMKDKQDKEDEMNKGFITSILSCWEYSIKDACCTISNASIKNDDDEPMETNVF